MRRDVFQAIADPTRREIISLIAHQSRNMNDLADHFQISRPAVSKHMKILTECGLIEVQTEGRERHCRAKVEKLSEVSKWVEQFRELWEARLDALDSYLKTVQKKTK